MGKKIDLERYEAAIYDHLVKLKDTLCPACNSNEIAILNGAIIYDLDKMETIHHVKCESCYKDFSIHSVELLSGYYQDIDDKTGPKMFFFEYIKCPKS